MKLPFSDQATAQRVQQEYEAQVQGVRRSDNLAFSLFLTDLQGADENASYFDGPSHVAVWLVRAAYEYLEFTMGHPVSLEVVRTFLERPFAQVTSELADHAPTKPLVAYCSLLAQTDFLRYAENYLAEAKSHIDLVKRSRTQRAASFQRDQGWAELKEALNASQLTHFYRNMKSDKIGRQLLALGLYSFGVITGLALAAYYNL